MSRVKLIFLALLAVILLFPAQALSGNSMPPTGRVVVVLVDKVTWSEIAAAQPPNLTSLARMGAIGMLSNKTAEANITSGGAYLTIGSGMRALGPPAGSELGPVDLTKIARQNARGRYGAKSGLLVDRLNRAGKSTAVLGNADAAGSPGREVRLIGMNGVGQVDGDVSKRVLGKNGLTDYSALFSAYDNLSRRHDLIVIETGDTRRAEMAGSDQGAASARKLKRRALLSADAFIGRIAARLDFTRDMLVIISPSPTSRAQRSVNGVLTPVIAVGKLYEPGLLASPSTRRPGLLTNMDIAPTVADHLGVAWDQGAPGHVLGAMPAKVSFSSLAETAGEHELAERLAVPIIVAYAVLAAVAVLAGAFLIGFHRFAGERIAKAVRGLLILTAAVPLASFIVPLVPFALDSEWNYLGYFPPVIALLVLLARSFRSDPSHPVLALTAATSIFIFGNLLARSPGDIDSAFGYTAVTAARFYGLGNDYMAFLFAAALLSSLLWLDRTTLRRPSALSAIAVFFLLLVVVVGHGSLGANTGGIIMGVPTLVLAYLRIRQERFVGWQILIGAGAGLAALFVFSLADAWRAGGSAHLGAAARQVYGGQIGAFGLVVARKIQTSLSLFDQPHTGGYVPVIVGLVLVVGYWTYRNCEFTAVNHPGARIALVVGTAGGILGSFVNDSGVAIAALMTVFLTNCVFYIELAGRDRAIVD